MSSTLYAPPLVIADLQLEPRVYVPNTECPQCLTTTIWLCNLKYQRGSMFYSRFCCLCETVLPNFEECEIPCVVKLQDKL